MKRFAVAMLGVILCATTPAAASADTATGLLLFDRGLFDEAAQELAPSAEAGDPAAQYVLGLMYLNRMVEPAGPDRAAALITEAAEAGHLQAQTELARMYRDGDGVDQDFGQMMQWYERAANQGDVGAQLFLADGYGYGLGIEQDLVESYKWYEIAIQYWGPLAVRARDVIAEQMTEEQIAEAVRRAGKWLAENR